MQNQPGVTTLQDISQGTALPVEKPDTGTVINASKIANNYLREFVKAFRISKISESDIVELLLNLDLFAEEGKINEDFFQKLKSDPDFINKISNKQ